MRALIPTLVAAALVASPALAEDAVGDWVGKVKAPGDVELTLAAHLQKAAGGLEGYAESPDQVVDRIPLADIAATPDSLIFSVPSVSGRFTGKWDPAAKAWVGTFTQGAFDMPLSLARGLPPPRPTVPGLDGEWTGVLNAPIGDLHLILSVKTDANGTLALFQSPDQSPRKAVVHLTHKGDEVTIELKGVGGFDGKLSADGKALEGHWRQGGGSLPLVLTKGG